MTRAARAWLRVHWLQVAGAVAGLAVAAGVAWQITHLTQPAREGPAAVAPAPAVTVTASATATIWRPSPRRTRLLPGDRGVVPPEVVSRVRQQPQPSPQPSPSPFRPRPRPVPSATVTVPPSQGPLPTVTRTVTLPPTPPATTPPALPTQPACLDLSVLNICLSSLTPGGS